MSDTKPEPSGEYSGGNVNYYLIKIDHPKRHAPYTAECEDIIGALGMTFYEGCAFKAIWRSCARRTIGLTKRGSDDHGIYDAEKTVHYGKLMLGQRQRAAGKAPEWAFDAAAQATIGEAVAACTTALQQADRPYSALIEGCGRITADKETVDKINKMIASSSKRDFEVALTVQGACVDAARQAEARPGATGFNAPSVSISNLNLMSLLNSIRP